MIRTPPFALLAILALLAAAPPACADEFAAALAAGAEAERRLDPHAALGHYRRAEALRPDDPFVLQKIAQQISDALFLDGDAGAPRERVLEALLYARRAADGDPDSAVNRLSLAILYGRLAAHSGAAEKVRLARLIRQHAEEAVSLDPEYAWAYHVLGRWHLEMAALGATRRTLAALLFGGLPPASEEKAILLLERAVELEPESIAHRVELGRAYERTGHAAKARDQWALSLQLPASAIHDELSHRTARDGLNRLGSDS